MLIVLPEDKKAWVKKRLQATKGKEQCHLTCSELELKERIDIVWHYPHAKLISKAKEFKFTSNKHHLWILTKKGEQVKCLIH